jgi:predicted NACHT family NTPase
LELARNPYRLWMLQEVYSKHGELPANRTVLFKRMVDQLLERQKEVGERVEPQPS